MSDNNRQIFRCRNPDCRTEFTRNIQPCPACQSSVGMDIILVTTEQIILREKLIAEVATLKRNYPWFIATVIVTKAAPFITAFMHPILGIAVGLGFGYASLRLGKKAYILIKRIYESG